MHVLVATHDLYPDPGSGGTGRYVYETGRRLVDRGHDVTVVTRRRGDGPHRETVAGMDVWRYDVEIADRTAPAILPQLPKAARSVRRAVRSVDPDLVSLQGPVTGQFVDALAPGEIPRSYTFHSPWPTEYRLRTRDGPLPRWRRAANIRLRRVLERRLLGRTDEIVTLSRYMRRQLRDRYGRQFEPRVIPGGVDTALFHPAAGEPESLDDGPEPDETALLTVRRLSPRMGHRLLLRAFAEVAATRPDAHLYVAGDGPLRDRLHRMAGRLDLDDRVTFVGYVPDEALPGLYARADLFVLPTVALEGFGLATLEALASGTPVVGTPVGGTVEILDPCERRESIPQPLLARSAETEALAEALVRWTAMPQERRERAGAACRRYAVEHYRWESAVDALEAVYEARMDDGGSVETGDSRGRPVDHRRTQVQR